MWFWSALVVDCRFVFYTLLSFSLNFLTFSFCCVTTCANVVVVAMSQPQTQRHSFYTLTPTFTHTTSAYRIVVRTTNFFLKVKMVKTDWRTEGQAYSKVPVHHICAPFVLYCHLIFVRQEKKNIYIYALQWRIHSRYYFYKSTKYAKIICAVFARL